MLFMGPQTLLDLFAQFKQSLQTAAEAQLPHKLPPAPRHPTLCSRCAAYVPVLLHQWLQPDATSSRERTMASVPCEAAACPRGCHIIPSPTHCPRVLSTSQNLYLELRKRDGPGQSRKAAVAFPLGNPAQSSRMQEQLRTCPGRIQPFFYLLMKTFHTHSYRISSHEAFLMKH